MNSDDRENYILSYEIENDEIEIKLASETVCTAPYSKENEENDSSEKDLVLIKKIV